MDGEYVGPEDAFAGQIWVGVSENDTACFPENDLASDEPVNLTACEGDTKSGFVCDLDGEKDVATDLICGLYADGYTLVVCVDRDGEVKQRDREAENRKPESNGISGGDGRSGAVLCES